MEVQEILEKLGNINMTQLADKFKVTRQAVTHWKKNGVPLLRQYQIKEMIDDTTRGDTSKVSESI